MSAKKNMQAVVNNNSKNHTYGYAEAGGEQQNTPFKTSDFQYNPGNFCYEIVENSAFDSEEGKSFRQLHKNRYKPLGITGRADFYNRTPVLAKPVPDFGALKEAKLTGEEERFRLTGFKHRATYSIPRAGEVTDQKPTKIITGQQVLHRRYNEFNHHQGKWTYKIPEMMKPQQELKLRTFQSSSPG